MSVYYERTLTLGAYYLGEGRCRFRVWAPEAEQVRVVFPGAEERVVPLVKRRRGYWQETVEGVELGANYFFRLDGMRDLPDPASRFQPRGVQGPSRVTDRGFTWNDGHWFGIPLQDFVIYQVHVGTFTPEGTFGAILPHLSALRELGVTALELMPVMQFSQDRNWGYDPAFFYAVHNGYGGPVGLKRLVDACHLQGIAVILEAPYAYTDREGCVLKEYAPYYTSARRTDLGPSLNLNGPDSDEVRRFFVENALYWFDEFHIDGLRLDAVDCLMDESARPFVEDLVHAVSDLSDQLNRRIYLFTDNPQNDARLIRNWELGGWGFNACWNDDFHHSLHSLLTGEQNGYYKDYGYLRHFVKAYTEGFVYTGQRSQFRNRRFGSFSGVLPAKRFIVYAQNHREVGWRPDGLRLSRQVGLDSLKLAAGAVLLSPYVPLLFMGEEYGETAPFYHFTSFSSPETAQARREELNERCRRFGWRSIPMDPQDEAAFQASKLNPHAAQEPQRLVLRDFHRELLRLRRSVPALFLPGKLNLEVTGWGRDRVMYVRRWCEGSEVFIGLNFSDEDMTEVLPVPTGTWRKRLDSASEEWGGNGTVVPAVLHSVGEVALTLPRRAVVLFELESRE